MSEVKIGGERLGSGNKMKAYMRNFERSTHDLSYLWKSTMSAGTLVPFMVEVALPGDTFDIQLDADALTHPTIGPLFGSYKMQLDVFQIPMRLYNAKLHMNMLGIGMDMSSIQLPQLQIYGKLIEWNKPIDNQQINPSCIFSYLNIRGIGSKIAGGEAYVGRQFNAIPYLGYWDIYKNYYANKQEEIGAVIHQDPAAQNITISDAGTLNGDGVDNVEIPLDSLSSGTAHLGAGTTLSVNFNIPNTDVPKPEQIEIDLEIEGGVFDGLKSTVRASQIWQNWKIASDNSNAMGSNVNADFLMYTYKFNNLSYNNNANPDIDSEPEIVTFPLSNIDDMRINILQYFGADPFTIVNTSQAPYGLPLMIDSGVYSQLFSQEGLALKTYNSDLFNNWISTEWIDGADGISAVTAIDTSGGSFTIDELNLSKKIYDMLNRIALSGGSYDDWLDAVYTHDRQRSAENPMYLGGLIKKIAFQEVVSNAATLDKPLGTLAGRGKIIGGSKGGYVVAKVDEPSYIMGIVSITPNVDYSQGNKWDVNLKTMNDLHKPSLDEIGFQDLITDQMAWFDTGISMPTQAISFQSAGKQPAWINYMTNVNIVRGNFAKEDDQMYMTLNRRYNATLDVRAKIKDLTTYIDPAKFNHIFADTRRDAQNFWVQIAVNNTARRKMSAKVIPNL